MPKLLHAADIHLDARFLWLGERGGEYRTLVRQTFDDIIGLAQRERSDMLLLVGDLFDSNDPDRQTLQHVAAQLAGLAIPVCILPGNHDCYSRDSVYRKQKFADNVHLFVERPTIKHFPELGLTVAGNPLLSKHDSTPPLANLVRQTAWQRWYVALAHGNMQNIGAFESTTRPIHPHEIAATQADYVALGDWHRFADYSQGNVRAFYSGAPEPTTFTQTETGKVASIVISADTITVTPITVGRATVCTRSIDITGLTEQELSAKIIESADPHTLLHVTLTGLKSPDHFIDIDGLVERLSDYFYYLKISDSAPLGLTEINPDDYPEAFVIGQYVRLMQAEIAQTTDERARRVAERALQLGVALLNGEKVL